MGAFSAAESATRNLVYLFVILRPFNVMHEQVWKSGAGIIKLITAVIYGFCNKLECLSLNTRIGWKGLPETNTPAYYGNRKLRP